MLDHIRRLFVPHHSNNHKPRVLHLSSLLSLVGLLLVVQGGVSWVRRSDPQILGFATNISPQRVVELTNNERAKLGLPSLTMDARLSDAARRKAADMLNNNYWAHVSPSGTKPWSFILAAGYNYLHAGENLARDFTNPDTAVAAWMASPTHRDNIVSARYRDIGVAVVDGTINGVETTLVVQMFGAQQAFNPQVNAGTTSVVKPAEAAEVKQVVVPVAEAKVVVTQSPISETVQEPDPTPTPTPASWPRFEAYWMNKALSLSFAILVMVVLAIDWLVVWRKNLVRLSGKSWAHLTYLLFVVILTIVIKQGLIL